MLIAMLGLAVYSLWMNPWDHRLSVGQHFHVSVWGGDWDIRLVFFNDADYGPYRGSTISVDGNPPLRRELYFGDTAGVYYRYFGLAGSALWTLMVSIWYPVALFSILPSWQLLRMSRVNSEKPPAPYTRLKLTGDTRDG